MTANQAILRHGDPLMADHTPGSALDSGAVVVIGARPFVTHRAIAASTLGAVAAGGGVYKMTAGGAAGAGVDVYWNASAGKVNAAATATTGDKHFGYVAPGSVAAADADVIDVVHAPDGSAAS